MTEKEVTEKALENEMIPIQVKLFKPYFDFMQEYIKFFGYKGTIEDLAREMIYWHVELLHQELGVFTKMGVKFVSEETWRDKWPHITITANEPLTESSYTQTVEFTNIEFAEAIDRAAEKEGMDRDEFIRHVVRKELEKLKQPH